MEWCRRNIAHTIYVACRRKLYGWTIFHPRFWKEWVPIKVLTYSTDYLTFLALQFYTHGVSFCYNQYFVHSNLPFFKNRFGTWSFDRAQGNFSIPQPALYIMPTNDPVADWEVVSAALHSSSFIAQLTTEVSFLYMLCIFFLTLIF
jgi:hypothetical protein